MRRGCVLGRAGWLAAVPIWFFLAVASLRAADVQNPLPVSPADDDVVLVAQQPKAGAGSGPARTPPVAKPTPPPVATPTPPVAPEPAERPAPFPPPDRLASTSPIARGSLTRLASVPNMFGDFLNQNGQVQIVGPNNVALASDLPGAGGSRLKIAENNKALPMDRVYLMYNHYENALQADLDLTTPGGLTNRPVDRYVVGMEKKFLGDRWSIDLRMPLTNRYRVETTEFELSGGSVGDLSIALKRLLLATETSALAVGLALDVPTGSDVDGRIGKTLFTVRNQAVHLGPFVGALLTPTDHVFCQGFLQIDVAANGEPVDYTDLGNNVSGELGRLNDQTLFYVDLCVGYWLTRNPAATLSGMACLAEFHYTGSLQGADVVSGKVNNVDLNFGNLLGEIDVPNVTLGLHAELNHRTEIRVGGVFPLRDRPNRAFDAEAQVSVNRRF